MSRRVLVTGAASGLGRAMAARFAAEGWRVLAADVDAKGLEQLTRSASGTLVTRVLDVRDDDDWAAARAWCEEHWDGLDVLVNNAGVASGGLFETQSMSDWDWILELNLKSVVRGCAAFVPLFKRQGQGQIVNVASMAGLALLPAMSSYNVTKAGVIALSQTLRYELAPYGTSVTVVCPAFVRTNLTASMTTSTPSAVSAAGRMMDSSKVTADDVAEKVLDAVQHKRFLVLTHADTKVLRLLQRLAPRLVDVVIARQWEKQRHRLERDAAAVAGVTVPERRIVLITGASSGLGAQMAREFAARGHTLALAARRTERLEELRTELLATNPGATVAIRELDVTDSAAVFEVVHGFREELGGLDRVIVNAGLGKGQPLGTGRFDANLETATTNFVGALAQMEAAMEVFRDQGHGHLVVISSISALRGQRKNLTTYAATKAGVAMLAEGLRAELWDSDIVVSTIYPGYIRSEMNERVKSAPFMVGTEAGVRAMVAAIEKERATARVPAWPWRPLGTVLRFAPLGVVRRLG